MHIVYLGIGSNIDKQRQIRRCLDLLRSDPDVRWLRASPVFENRAIGPAGEYSDQEAFLNLAVELRWPRSIPELTARIRQWEESLGRVRNADTFAPRHIDIDLLLIDDRVETTPEYTLPHPRLADAAFLLLPLVELEPALQHPALRLPLPTLLRNLTFTRADFWIVDVS